MILDDDSALNELGDDFLNLFKKFNLKYMQTNFTLNQVLSGHRVFYYGNSITADDDIYGVSECVKREKSAKCTDELSLMGDTLYNQNYLFNYKRNAGVCLKTMEPCKIIYPHYKGSNINYMGIECGFGAELIGRKKACGLLEHPRREFMKNTIFPIYAKGFKQVVHFIDGNFLNTSIVNLDIISYSENKIINASRLPIAHKMRYEAENIEYEQCNSVKELTDIVYLNRLQIEGSNIYEISNDIYQCIQEGMTYNGLSFESIIDETIVQEQKQRRHKDNYVFYAQNIVTRERIKFDTYLLVCEFLAEKTGNKIETIARYYRNLFTGEIFTIGRYVKYKIWMEKKSNIRLW